MAMVALPSSWEELPPDLRGVVLHRLPSLADRVRLRAVCRPWRAAAAAAERNPRLPPPLPWLALRNGTLVDLQGTPVRCAPILRNGVFCYLTVDNLALRVHDDGACSLMNPLSGSTLPLPELAPAVRRALGESQFYNLSYILKTHSKAILSSPLHSTPDSLIAILIMHEHGVAVSACRQLDAITASIISPDPEKILKTLRICDIAFFRGKLYAITEHGGLHALEIDARRFSETKSSSLRFHQCIAEDPKQQRIYSYGSTANIGYLVLRYLVECSGKLLMIRRWMSFPRDAQLGKHDRTFRFEVFEADLATDPAWWINVDSLDGHAIFLDSGCSKSVLASKCVGGVQEDCMYFMHRVFDNPSREYFGPRVNPLGDSGVYNMRDGKITPLLPEVVMAELWSKQQYLSWFFPAGT